MTPKLLKIIKYEDMPLMWHVCVDEAGQKHQIDIMIDGGFPDTDPNDLVGKKISIGLLSPYLEIAHEVKVIE